MKFQAIISFLILTSLVFTCSCVYELPIAPPPPVPPIENPILEINSELRGMWDIEGKYLDLRLYGNGIVEYEDIDKDLKPGDRNIRNLVLKKAVQLPDKDLREIRAILNSKDFLNLKESYQPKTNCTDAYIYTTVRVIQNDHIKTIYIGGHCDDYLKQFEDFPVLLNDLLKRLRKYKD